MQLALILHLKGMQDFSILLSIVLFTVYISIKLLKKWTLELKKYHFLVLVLKYFSFSTVFLYHGFFVALKTVLREECLYQVLYFRGFILDKNSQKKINSEQDLLGNYCPFFNIISNFMEIKSTLGHLFYHIFHLFVKNSNLIMIYFKL